jgi:hypothetical protein
MRQARAKFPQQAREEANLFNSNSRTDREERVDMGNNQLWKFNKSNSCKFPLRMIRWRI